MEIGDAILNPRYGVGVIKSIEKRIENGVKRDYFVIPKPSISSTIFVPVDAADELGLRPLSTAEKLQQVVTILESETDKPTVCSEEHGINWGDPIELAHAIKSGVKDPASRYPKTSLQNQLKHAKKLLSEELSAVLGMSDESISALVDKKEKRISR